MTTVNVHCTSVHVLVDFRYIIVSVCLLLRPLVYADLAEIKTLWTNYFADIMCVHVCLSMGGWVCVRARAGKLNKHVM